MDAGLLIVRLVLGLTMAAGELGAGLLLAIGLLTPAAAAVLVALMLTALVAGVAGGTVPLVARSVELRKARA